MPKREKVENKSAATNIVFTSAASWVTVALLKLLKKKKRTNEEDVKGVTRKKFILLMSICVVYRNKSIHHIRKQGVRH